MASNTPQKPVITDVRVAEDNLTDGGVFSVTLTVSSNTEVNWLSQSLKGPNESSLMGIGQTHLFEKIEEGVWQTTLKYNISADHPSGRYYYSHLSVRNKTLLYSDPWGGQPSITVDTGKLDPKMENLPISFALEI